MEIAGGRPVVQNRMTRKLTLCCIQLQQQSIAMVSRIQDQDVKWNMALRKMCIGTSAAGITWTSISEGSDETAPLAIYVRESEGKESRCTDSPHAVKCTASGIRRPAPRPSSSWGSGGAGDNGCV